MKQTKDRKSKFKKGQLVKVVKNMLPEHPKYSQMIGHVGFIEELNVMANDDQDLIRAVIFPLLPDEIKYDPQDHLPWKFYEGELKAVGKQK